MALANCPRCRGLFNSALGSVCPKCEKADEDRFILVRQYIEDHPESTIQEVVEGTEVSAKRILQYLREGRLTTSAGLAGELDCMKCGEPVSSGNYCDKCAANLAEKLMEGGGKTIKPSVGMHIRRG